MFMSTTMQTVGEMTQHMRKLPALFVSILVVGLLSGCDVSKGKLCFGGTCPTPTGTPTPTPTPTATPFPNDQHLAQTPPVKMGTSGGNANDVNATFCCSGTLGALIQRGGSFFILSNNHVLDKADLGVPGTDPIVQPGLIDNNCAVKQKVATLTEAAKLKPASAVTGGPCAGSTAPLCGFAPSNVDASIAAIITTPTLMVDTTGSILDLGAAGTAGIAAAPPSLNLAVPTAVLSANEGVAKSGRSSGLTCSTLQSISTQVSIDYDSACNGALAFTSIFNNQLIIKGATFSSTGDSGSLIVTADTARPLGLLYGGNGTSTSANPIQDVITAFTTASGTPVIVGAGDHAVSCVPQVSIPSANLGPGNGAAALSASEQRRVSTVQLRRSDELMRDPAFVSVEVGASEDNPGEGALLIQLSAAPRAPVPPVIDGVRTKVVFTPDAGALRVPGLSADDIDRTTATKEVYAGGLMSQPGVQGVGVGRSNDNSQETAIVIYVISGMPRTVIPQLLDGVRTQIVEGERFRAFGWGKETRPGLRCTKK
jgi:hypothetical protein